MSSAEPLTLGLNSAVVAIRYERQMAGGMCTTTHPPQRNASDNITTLDLFRDAIEDPETRHGTVILPVNDAAIARFNWISSRWKEVRFGFSHGAINFDDVLARRTREIDQSTIYMRLSIPRDLGIMYDREQTCRVMQTAVISSKDPNLHGNQPLHLEPLGRLLIEPAREVMASRELTRDERGSYHDVSDVGEFLFGGHYPTNTQNVDPRKAKANTGRSLTPFLAVTMESTHLHEFLREHVKNMFDVFMLPPDRCLDITPTRYSYGIHHYPDPHTVPVKWHDMAFLREPYLHVQIVDLALTYPNLPPYVLLEIFDWLPEASRMGHRRKIDLIMSLQKSIRKVRGVADFRFAIDDQ